MIGQAWRCDEAFCEECTIGHISRLSAHADMTSWLAICLPGVRVSPKLEVVQSRARIGQSQAATLCLTSSRCSVRTSDAEFRAMQ